MRNILLLCTHTDVSLEEGSVCFPNQIFNDLSTPVGYLDRSTNAQQQRQLLYFLMYNPHQKNKNVPKKWECRLYAGVICIALFFFL